MGFFFFYYVGVKGIGLMEYIFLFNFVIIVLSLEYDLVIYFGVGDYL